MNPKSSLALFVFMLLSLFNIELNAQDLVINELMYYNDMTIEDEFGEFTDWIEIYNRGSVAVNLGDYYLSDDILELMKWKMPDLMLEAGAFQLVFASDRDTLFHANFKIASEGERIFLSNSVDGLIHAADSVKLKGDQSYGRDVDGSELWKVFHLPSPGISNNSSNALYLSHKRGFHSIPFYLKIYSEREMPVYYTLDGSMPTESSLCFPDSLFIDFREQEANGISLIPTTQAPPVEVIKSWEPPLGITKKATVIKCQSFQDGDPTSPVYSATFIVDPQGSDRYSLPVFSFITDSLKLFDYDSGLFVPGIHADPSNNRTGNYFERGIEWERPVHIEYFEADGEPALVQDGGIRIHGQYSRRAAQKSLRLYARNEYGKKYFTYPLLPAKDTKEYKRFVLRSSMTTFGSRFGDAFIANRLRDLNYEVQDYQPVIVYVNGEYWGVHNMRDYIDENYIHSLHPEVHEDSINMLRFNGQVMVGNNQNYWELLNFVRNNPMANHDNFNHILGLIDYSNYLDYCITEIYMANRDWPGNNVTYWQTQHEDSKWRWILNDLDASFIFPDLDMFNQAMDSTRNLWPNPEWSTFLFRNMCTNDLFRKDFICRSMELMKSEFNPEEMIKQIAGYGKQFVPEMEEHILRWNFPESKESWMNYYDSIMVRFADTRPVFYMDHMTSAFGITQKEIFELCECCDSNSLLEVEFQNPVHEGVVDSPADVVVEALNVNGGDGVRMSLFINDKFISTDSEEPYRWDPAEFEELMNIPEGDYELKILAYDTDGFTSATALNSIVVVETTPGSLVLLGNPADSAGTEDFWTSSMVINKTDVYTNRADTILYLRLNNFSFFAQAQADPVTPFIVRVNGDNDFTVLAVGDTRNNENYLIGENHFPFNDGLVTTLALLPGETIATGFLDAYPDGMGGGLGPVIPFNEIAPADELWYSGGPEWYKSGSVTIGQPPAYDMPPRTYYLRNYLYNIALAIADTIYTGMRPTPLSSQLELSIFPNPVSGDFVNLSLRGRVGPINVTIYDLQGKVIYKHNYEEELIQIETRELSRAGTYLISVESSSDIAYGKLIVIK